MNGILVRLEGDARVARESDPGDRRRNVVSITRAGRARLAELQRHADAVQNELLVGLDPAERVHLVRLLDVVLAHHPALSA